MQINREPQNQLGSQPELAVLCGLSGCFSRAHRAAVGALRAAKKTSYSVPRGQTAYNASSRRLGDSR